MYREHDKSKAICHTCEEIVETTFQFREIPFSTGGTVNTLAGICTQCDSIVSTPVQSTPDIKEARNAL